MKTQKKPKILGNGSETTRPLTNPEIEYILFAHEFFPVKALAAELRVSEVTIYRIIQTARINVIDARHELQTFLRSLTNNYVRFKVFQESHTDLSERNYLTQKAA